MSKVMFIYFLRRAVKKAKLIVVPSNFTKGELLKRFPEAKGKVEVVYNFVSEKFFVGSATTERPAVEGDYILFVGNRKKHKNLKNLVLAFSLLVDRFGYKLVIVGGRDKNQKEDEMDRLIRELGIDDRVVQLDKASDETLMNLYKNAKLLVLPSFYEGFGLPPLEALACGCPVIVSKIPVFEETLGSEIALFDPSSVDDMKAKIEEALMDPSKRLRILEIGKEILPKFSKERVAKDYERILSSV